ncbi:MAG: hypothetical protein RIQ70_1239 [Bacteroidota bacterium]|jgi:putative PIN family toxin of toxin-antitoxin system
MSSIKVVIDTNVLLKTLNRNNFEFFIYNSFIEQKFDWIVSNEILIEYEEVLTSFYSVKTSNLVLEILCNANNVIFSEPYFQWDIIKIDPDDNKFSDLAISANANYLITFDKHFDVFKEVEFPKLEVLSPNQFFKIL